MAKLIKVFKQGKTQVNLIEGEYQGKPTYSFTVQKNKFIKETKQFEKTEFFSAPDLRDLNICIAKILLNSVKEQKIEAKQKESPVAEEPAEEDEIPF